MKRLVFILSVFGMFSCAKPQSKQVVQGGIKIVYPASIEKNAEFVARMYSVNPKRKIVNALVECEDLTQIDSRTFKVKGCDKELLILGDTAFLAFQGTESGDFVFGDINVITADLQSENIQIAYISINYSVEE